MRGHRLVGLSPACTNRCCYASGAEARQLRKGPNGTTEVVPLTVRGDFLSPCNCDGLADVAFGLLQGGSGLGAGCAGGQHYYGYGSSVAGGFEGARGGFVIGSGGLFDDADGALDELLVLRPDVDHEVAVDVAEARHRSGGDHIQDHLVGCAGFHAGGSGQNFRADFGDDGEMGGALEWRIAVAGEGDGAGSAVAAVLDGGDGERGASAGGDAENNVVLAGFPFFHFRDREFHIVFAGFGGSGERFGASRHDVLHGARIGIEGGLNFGSVESAETAAGSGAHVDEAHDFERGHAIHVSRRWKDLFGGQPAEIGLYFAGWGQVVRLSVWAI